MPSKTVALDKKCLVTKHHNIMFTTQLLIKEVQMVVMLHERWDFIW